MAIHVNEGQGDSTIAPLSDEELSSVDGLGTFESNDLEGAKQFAREIGVEDRIVASTYVWDLRRQYDGS